MAHYSRKHQRKASKKICNHKKGTGFPIKKVVEGLYLGYLNIKDIPQKQAFFTLDNFFKNGLLSERRCLYNLSRIGYFDEIIFKRRKNKWNVNPGLEDVESIIKLAAILAYKQHRNVDIMAFNFKKGKPADNFRRYLSEIYNIKVVPFIASKLLKKDGLELFQQFLSGKKVLDLNKKEQQFLLEVPHHFAITEALSYVRLRVKGASTLLAEKMAVQLSTCWNVKNLAKTPQHWRLLLDIALRLEQAKAKNITTKVYHFAAMLPLADHWIRKPKDFPVEEFWDATDDVFFTELVKHLLVKYEVPVFLWPLHQRISYHYQNYERERLMLFIHLAQGGSVRKAPKLPYELSKTAAHFFLKAPKTAGIKQACRYGQLKAIGASESLAADLSLILAQLEISDEPFLKSVMHFFTQQFKESPKALSRMVLYIGIKYRTVENYSLKGRTKTSFTKTYKDFMENVLESLQPNARNRFGNLQNVQAEYRQILNLYLRKFPWRRQEIENFEWKENETIYNIHQLNTAKDVEAEGKVMSHCVGSYVSQCMDGRCSIWSMTYTMPNGFKDRMVTIEVRDKKVVQVKGKSNRPANVKEMDVLKQWKRVAKLA